MRDPRFLPVATRDAGPFFADIAADELAVVGQRRCHRQCAVTGKGADLERAPRADHAYQQREQRALVGADLHATLFKARCFLP